MIRAEDFKYSEKACPACGEYKMYKRLAVNALSRYVKRYICSDCGTREALWGFFWQSNSSRLKDEESKETVGGGDDTT